MRGIRQSFYDYSLNKQLTWRRQGSIISFRLDRLEEERRLGSKRLALIIYSEQHFWKNMVSIGCATRIRKIPGNVKANHQSSIAQKYEAASKLCCLFPTGNSQMFGETSRYPKQTNIGLGTMDSLMSPSYVLQVARPVLNRSSQQLNFLQTTNLNKRDRVHPD